MNAGFPKRIACEDEKSSENIESCVIYRFSYQIFTMVVRYLVMSDAMLWICIYIKCHDKRREFLDINTT